MSNHGGDAHAMSAEHAADMNDEMNAIEMEIMGPQNVAVLVMEDAMSNMDFNEYSDNGHEGQDDNLEPFHPVNLPDPPDMAQMPPHLQDLHPQQAAVVVMQQAQQLANFQFGGGGGLVIHDMAHGLQHNLSLVDYLHTWAIRDANNRRQRRLPDLEYLNFMQGEKIKVIKRSDLKGEQCDFQGINWEKMGIASEESRYMRRRLYKNYRNLHAHYGHREELAHYAIDYSQSYFKFRRMDFTRKPHHAHFQLRNLVTCTSRNTVYFAGRSKIYQSSPLFNSFEVKMNLTDPYVTPAYPSTEEQTGMSISAIAAGHGILVAGGFGGEYALRSTVRTENDYTMGLVTKSDNPITNHVDVTVNRHSRVPQAVFASNDHGIRVLDAHTETFVHTGHLDFLINCTAQSPDSRLRVAVGDSDKVLILNAETSEVLQELSGPYGHQDYGFACAWADNGWTVATGNQDEMVKIWDARMWTDHSGRGRPVRTISSYQSSVRSLKFSPVGSGKRILVAAEQADIVNVIDAETFCTKQQIEFYGENVGTSLSPDGQSLFVGITDSCKGGIMEFERCGHTETYGDRRLDWDRGQYIEAEDLGDRWTRGEDGELRSIENEHPFAKLDSGLDWRTNAEESAAQANAKRTARWHKMKICEAGDVMPSNPF